MVGQAVDVEDGVELKKIKRNEQWMDDVENQAENSHLPRQK
jgi:hypothetical protein